ncbi:MULTISPECIES: hypothetical protein [unclassified Pseudomonas]|uniref:hypothetical protein n=1 Tax=Pseudomonas TaxID=286 RepID=UPI0024B360CE|nr:MULTISPECIES: hypothetical protein [unclassified Pseudomonas]
MTNTLFTRHKTPLLLAGVLFINALVLGWVVVGTAPWVPDRTMMRTQEPLLIEGPQGDEQAYVLPTGTTLYHDKSFAEGHDRYVVYLNHKGAIAHEEVPMKPEYKGNFISPLWMSNVDADALKNMFKRFPLSREDVAAAIKSNEITRDDLADIIRSLPE